MSTEEETKALVIAQQAYEMSLETRERCIKTEERAKSLQHRIDSQDMKMNAILLDLKEIKTSTNESNIIQKHIKKQVTFFTGLISVAASIFGIIRVIFMIADRYKL